MAIKNIVKKIRDRAYSKETSTKMCIVMFLTLPVSRYQYHDVFTFNIRTFSMNKKFIQGLLYRVPVHRFI
jgi:hypothetical protein